MFHTTVYLPTGIYFARVGKIFYDFLNRFKINNIAEIQGVFFIGLPWLRKRKSGLIAGIEEDAEYICQQLQETILSGEATTGY